MRPVLGIIAARVKNHLAEDRAMVRVLSPAIRISLAADLRRPKLMMEPAEILVSRQILKENHHPKENPLQAQVNHPMVRVVASAVAEITFPVIVPDQIDAVTDNSFHRLIEKLMSYV